MRPKYHKRKLGDEFTTNQGYKAYVIEYHGPFDVLAEIREPVVYQFKTTANQLRRGSIKNRYAISMSGVGFIGQGDYSWTKNPRAHKLLTGLLERCYRGREQHGNYVDCTAVAEWYNFQNFAKWCYDQKEFDEKGWHLDKDILVKGNRVYGPETCCFVPQEINSLFVLKRNFRGDEPIGVIKNKWGRFCATCSNKGMMEKSWKGPMRATAEEAFYDYKTYKEMVIKQRADEFKDRISPRVYEALYKYEVEITD